MSGKWTFETAADFWRRHSTGDPEGDPESVWDRFAAAEAFLLDHQPKSALEADIIFGVLLEQGPDGRGDGRDRVAMRHLRTYLRGLPESLAVAA